MLLNELLVDAVVVVGAGSVVLVAFVLVAVWYDDVAVWSFDIDPLDEVINQSASAKRTRTAMPMYAAFLFIRDENGVKRVNG